MTTIVCVQRLTPDQEESIRSAAQGNEVILDYSGELPPDTYREAEILCGWSRLAAEHCLAEGARLSWVQTFSAGVDRFPLEHLAHKGVLLTNAGGVHPVPMAETVFALLLGLTRGIHTAVRNARDAHWAKTPVLPEISGAALLIVGAGTIGQEVARIAKAFGMRTIGVTASGRQTASFDLVAGPDRLDDLLRDADFVVNLLPLTDATKQLFDHGRFACMKRSAYFINAGRGQTVVTGALIDALRGGTIAGAGLDVFEQEPLPADSELWAIDNLIMTPHIGGSTDRQEERVTELFIRNLGIYLAGGRNLHNLVDYSKGY